MKEDNSTSSSFRDSVATIDADGKRIWLFPKKPRGKFYKQRKIVGWILLFIVFGFPFIKYHGDPLFLFDVVKRKFILFGVHFWPQDSYLFAIATLSILVGIVLFTAVYGRFWCGWTCPQTVFLEILFRPIEYLIDGDRKGGLPSARRPDPCLRSCFESSAAGRADPLAIVGLVVLVVRGGAVIGAARMLDFHEPSLRIVCIGRGLGCVARRGYGKKRQSRCREK